MARIQNEALAYVILRFIIGLNIAIHGYVQMSDMPAFFAQEVPGFENTSLPLGLVEAFLWLLPPVEFVIGLLTIAGLFTRQALAIGGVMIASLTFGQGIQGPQTFATLAGHLTYGMVYFFLLFARRYNTLSLDTIVRKIDPSRIADEALAYSILRLTIGLNIAIHATERIADMPAFFAQQMPRFVEGGVLPLWLVEAHLTTLPWVELVVGLLTIVGLFTRQVLTAGGLMIASLTFGLALLGSEGVLVMHLTYVTVYSILLFTIRHNTLSLDTIVRKIDPI